VKMVMTGEGADELFAGYVYFEDAPSSDALQLELRRIFHQLYNVNLKRTDRMTMVRVPLRRFVRPF
jgi:asparagine synthase (glutamine-hydrolysing)